MISSRTLSNQKNNKMTKSILIAAMTLSSIAVVAQNQMRSINNNAPVKCRKKISIKANSNVVWTALTNIDDWKQWQTDISSSKINGNLEAQTTFDWKSGGAKIHSTLHTVKPNTQLGWTGKAMGILAIHNWQIRPEGEHNCGS